ncbi:hypothetical protein NLG97_g7317 [Lecanicillium saksenae]|uniref:Uncharacterized protein n=1 Tax=Lecanicillium saksenae TaxID=468837 RepID=A0ACC1QR02_9HYPO|nr:hypothetical protein NLG97_g7317 [Lecanicillium saksenae]
MRFFSTLSVAFASVALAQSDEFIAAILIGTRSEFDVVRDRCVNLKKSDPLFVKLDVGYFNTCTLYGMRLINLFAFALCNLAFADDVEGIAVLASESGEQFQVPAEKCTSLTKDQPEFTTLDVKGDAACGIFSDKRCGNLIKIYNAGKHSIGQERFAAIQCFP